MRQAGDNYVIFKTDTLFEDKVKIQGGHLYFDSGFEPPRHTRTYGEVYQVPLRLKKIPMSQERNGTPEYFDETPYRYTFTDQIEMEVQVGDRIYFHYNIIMRMNQQIVHEEVVDGKKIWYFRVRYDSIQCAVRNGVIIPIGSYVLVEPDMESIDEILIPIALMGADGKPLRDQLGGPILAPKEKWLQKKVAPSAKPLRGRVAHIGSPLKGCVCELKVGDLVYFRPNADWTNKIEGNEYYTIRQGHILGRVPE